MESLAILDLTNQQLPSCCLIETCKTLHTHSLCEGGKGLCADRLPRSLAIMPGRDDCSNKGRGD